MATGSKTLVITPTYNERENIPVLLSRLLAEAPACDILVVDDNSPDGTADLVREHAEKAQGRVHLLRRPGKQGLGTAYLEGFRWGLDHGYDRFVQMDADLSHSPADVVRLLAALDSSDMALSRRYMPGGGVVGWSLFRRLVSRFGNFYARTLLSLRYRDLTGGFNAFTRRVLEGTPVEDISIRGYSFLIELKYRVHQSGFRISEVPILFTDRTRGKSKMSLQIAREAATRVLAMRTTNPSSRKEKTK